MPYVRNHPTWNAAAPWLLAIAPIVAFNIGPTICRADIAPPTFRQIVNAPVKVQPPQQSNYKIVIPHHVLKVAMHQLGQTEQAPSNLKRSNRSLFAGLALSAAMCSLVLVRRNSKALQVVVVLTFGLAGYCGQQAYADYLPSPRVQVTPPRPAPAVTAPGTATIQIEISKFARTVELTLPQEPQATQTAPRAPHTSWPAPTPIPGYGPTPIPGYGPTPIPGYGPTSIPGYGPASSARRKAQ